MSDSLFRDRLQARLDSADRRTVNGFQVQALSDGQISQLEQYFSLLRRWNRRINLTALPLETMEDQTIDRLFVEPLNASRFVDEGEFPWADLGSGGGSPAVPLKIARPAAHLTMVESRSRKAAFLRQVVRELRLQGVAVAAMRAEMLEAMSEGPFELITVRAVRLDAPFLTTVEQLLRPTGRAMFFLAHASSASSDRLAAVDGLSLPTTNGRIVVVSRDQLRAVTSGRQRRS